MGMNLGLLTFVGILTDSFLLWQGGWGMVVIGEDMREAALASWRALVCYKSARAADARISTCSV